MLAGDSHNTRSRNCEIGGAINFFHVMMKRRDIGGDVFAMISIADQAFIPRAGKMNYLKRGTAQQGQ